MLVLILILLTLGAFAQTSSANDTGQKPTEKSVEGSGVALETERRNEVIPTNEADPTLQAPITRVKPE